MFVRVDENDDTCIEGFSYLNRDMDEEKVEIYSNDLVEIAASGDHRVAIFSEDIPKLIKALQAAYDHIQKGK